MSKYKYCYFLIDNKSIRISETNFLIYKGFCYHLISYSVYKTYSLYFNYNFLKNFENLKNLNDILNY